MRDSDIYDFTYMDRKKKRKGKLGKIILAILIIVLVILACVAYIVLTNDIGKFGTDYWYEMGSDGEEDIITADGWRFDLNIVQNYTLEGIVLATKLYYKHESPWSPINTFSPIDIFVGIDDVADNVSKYDYHISSFKEREVRWLIYYDDYEDYEYFRSHTGNNHLIPHNSNVYSKMLNLKTNDKFNLTGKIVEPRGTNGEYWYTWPSDTQIGNYECEVILVDTLLVW